MKKLPCGVFDHWQHNRANFFKVDPSFVFIVDTHRDIHALVTGGVIQIPVVETRTLLYIKSVTMEKTNNGQLLTVDKFEICQGEEPTVCGSNLTRRSRV